MQTQLDGLKKKDLVTLAGAASGVASIAFSATGNYSLAGLAILLAAGFDYYDGKVARNTSTVDEFGKQLDSLCDVISFGAAPAALVLAQNAGALEVLAALLYVIAGTVRLARFNLQAARGKFIGMPIPAAGLLVAFCAVLLPHFVAVAAMYLCALAMVGTFTIRKV